MKHNDIALMIRIKAPSDCDKELYNSNISMYPGQCECDYNPNVKSLNGETIHSIGKRILIRY